MLSQPVALRMSTFFNRSMTVLSSIGVNANSDTFVHVQWGVLRCGAAGFTVSASNHVLNLVDKACVDRSNYVFCL